MLRVWVIVTAIAAAVIPPAALSDEASPPATSVTVAQSRGGPLPPGTLRVEVIDGVPRVVDASAVAPAEPVTFCSVSVRPSVTRPLGGAPSITYPGPDRSARARPDPLIRVGLIGTFRPFAVETMAFYGPPDAWLYRFCH